MFFIEWPFGKLLSHVRVTWTVKKAVLYDRVRYTATFWTTQLKHDACCASCFCQLKSFQISIYILHSIHFCNCSRVENCGCNSVIVGSDIGQNEANLWVSIMYQSTKAWIRVALIRTILICFEKLYSVRNSRSAEWAVKASTCVLSSYQEKHPILLQLT